MKWDKTLYNLEWSQTISNYDEKMVIANKIASLVKDGEIIGFGSGSTAFLTVKAIAERLSNENLNIFAIPTSYEIKTACMALDIPTTSILAATPDWSFDGADEVDAHKWVIKGRGGAMFNEKLIISNSPTTYILVDQSKYVNKLGEKFPIPVECIPKASLSVKNKLLQLGASDVQVRLAGISKDGPVITESGNYILDVRFDNITEDLEVQIKSICGVLESGLFIGYNLEIVSS